MSESLTPFEGENLASYEALRTAVQLADGFTLIFAVTNTEAGAQEVMRRLWRDGVRYQKAWLRDPERPLVDQVVESVRSARLPVMVLGLEGLTTVGEALGRSLRNLNWTRPQWTARLPQTIVFWVTADMEANLAREAPDLWRFRSLRVEFTFRFSPRQARAADLRRRLNLELQPRIRLATLFELYRLTTSQTALEDAAKLVAELNDWSYKGRFRDLKRLTLASSEIDDESLDRLGPLNSLERLMLYRTNISDRCVAEMLERSLPSKLNHVDLRGTPIARRTLEMLAKLPNVQSLDIGTTLIRSEDIALLSEFKHLMYLELRGSLITDAELEVLCGINTLSFLLISRASVTDAGMLHIASLRMLWALELDGTNVTSNSLQPISKVRSLRSLDLSKTQVSNRGIEQLADLPRIERIRLAGSRVTQSGLKRLRDRFAAQRRKVEVTV